jgi:hypothetical protein
LSCPQALDGQVEQMAGGALRAMSSLWGSTRRVVQAAAKEIAVTVEEGVRDVSTLHAVKAASGCGFVSGRESGWSWRPQAANRVRGPACSPGAMI